MSTVITLLEELKATIDTGNYNLAHKKIELISQFFNDQLTQNEAGLLGIFLLFDCLTLIS